MVKSVCDAPSLWLRRNNACSVASGRRKAKNATGGFIRVLSSLWLASRTFWPLRYTVALHALGGFASPTAYLRFATEQVTWQQGLRNYPPQSSNPTRVPARHSGGCQTTEYAFPELARPQPPCSNPQKGKVG